ncbi:hypothetical protein BaRGS_00019378 [Batillaria attramentaria]|uniref:Uncharacterized protein n=1 Tax=Batillaria attramentaria TaxID=370345 RepID=A0ABD0KQK1_9CAEN
MQAGIFGRQWMRSLSTGLARVEAGSHARLSSAAVKWTRVGIRPGRKAGSLLHARQLSAWNNQSQWQHRSRSAYGQTEG